jgi:cell division inhibitor SulA
MVSNVEREFAISHEIVSVESTVPRVTVVCPPAVVASLVMPAVIYLRVSTKKQEQRNELNLPAQQKRCEDWCRAEGIPVQKVFSAAGESAWKTERPTLDEAIDFI